MVPTVNVTAVNDTFLRVMTESLGLAFRKYVKLAADRVKSEPVIISRTNHQAGQQEMASHRQN